MCCQTQQCVECGARTEKQTLEFKESVKLCWNLHCKYRVPKEGSTKFCVSVHQVYCTYVPLHLCLFSVKYHHRNFYTYTDLFNYCVTEKLVL